MPLGFCSKSTLPVCITMPERRLLAVMIICQVSSSFSWNDVHTSVMVVGVFICRIAETFSESRDILVLSIVWHKKIFFLPKHTFLWNEVTLAHETCCKTSFNLALCSSLVPWNTKTSSTQHMTPLRTLRMLLIHFWQYLGALAIPKGSLLKQKSSNREVNVVSCNLGPNRIF